MGRLLPRSRRTNLVTSVGVHAAYDAKFDVDADKKKAGRDDVASSVGLEFAARDIMRVAGLRREGRGDGVYGR